MRGDAGRTREDFSGSRDADVLGSRGEGTEIALVAGEHDRLAAALRDRDDDRVHGGAASRIVTEASRSTRGSQVEFFDDVTESEELVHRCVAVLSPQ